MREWWRRLRSYVRRASWAEELDEEMRLHLELRARSLREQGVSPDAAGREARLRFGNPAALNEASADAWRWLRFDALLQDLRFAWRRIGRARAASAAIVMTLGMGIGANTAMFTLLDAVLLRPAAAVDPDRLVWVDQIRVRSGRSIGHSFPGFVALARVDAFSGAAAFSPSPMSLGGQAPARVRGELVSGGYFEVLGVAAALGRTFRPDDDAVPGAAPVVVLSHALWTSHFGADPAVVGRSIMLNGRPFDVIGVAPRGFGGVAIEPVALWVPLAMAEQAMPGGERLLIEPGASWLSVVGRLRPGVSEAHAAAALSPVAAELNRRLAEPADEIRFAVQPVAGGLDPSNRRDALPILSLLSVVPALVLAVACANASNLLLAAGLARRKEFALRRSLGATRMRLVRQLLTESAVLAVGACAVGTVFSFALTAAVVHLADVPAEMAAVLRPSGRVLAASLLLAVLVSVLVGLAPSLSTTRPRLVPGLQDADTVLAVGRGRHRLRNAFLLAQVAISFVLVVTAGLFLRSVSRMVQVDPGFDPRGAVILSFDPDLQGYDQRRRQQFTSDLLRATRALSGVDSAALSSAVPLAGRMFGSEVVPEGQEAGGSDAASRVFFAAISPDYFHTMRIPLLEGRDFAERDDRAAPNVAIVNETLAVKLWPNRSPIGARFRFQGSDAPWREVVGVARDAKYDSFDESAVPFVYVPDRQQPLGRVTLIVRGRGEAGPLAADAERVVRALDPDLPIFDTGTLEGATRNAVDRQKAVSTLIGVFGGLALALATLGLAAVTAQAVARRRREIAIRLALGAQPRAAVLLFVREALWVCGLGVAIGLGASAAIAGALRSMLFGIGAADLPTYAGAIVLFAIVALVATVVPARRAAVVEPSSGLRQE